MRVLNKEEIIDIIYGSSFFGGGGGGSLEEGFALLELFPEEEWKINLVSIGEMEDNENIVSSMVAALGSPVATKGRTFSEESVNALLGMKAEAKLQGKELCYVYSGEQGGGNTIVSLYAAIKLGLPVLDLDGNGRAVPELNTGLLPIHKIPTSPVILANGNGDVIVGRAKDPLDSKACETIARQMCMAYDMGIGFSAWLMNKQDHLKASALGQITLTQKIGHILRTSEAESIFEKMKNVLGKSNVFLPVKKGVIKTIELNTENGFDYGNTVIEDENGREYTIRFQNENLVLFGPDGNAIETVPDIIAIVDIGEGMPLLPLSNTETKIGQKVMVFVARAHERWNDKDGYECWADVLKEAGYCIAGPRVIL